MGLELFASVNPYSFQAKHFEDWAKLAKNLVASVDQKGFAF